MKNEIKQVVETYFKGYAQAEPELLEQAFHPETRLYSGSEDGSLDRTEMSAWLENVRGRKAKGDLRQGTLEIASIDVVGDAALAKAVISFPKLQFTDFLSLIRIGGQWKIVGKIYHAVAR